MTRFPALVLSFAFALSALASPAVPTVHAGATSTPQSITFPAPNPLPLYGDAEFACVAAKQKAAGKYCSALFKGWAKWAQKGDDSKRDQGFAKALDKLDGAWSKAEAKSASDGVDCSAQTATSSAISANWFGAIEAQVYSALNNTDTGDKDDQKCVAGILKAAAGLCSKSLGADSKMTKGVVKKGADRAKRDAAKAKSREKFDSAFAKAIEKASCPTSATAEGAGDATEAIAGGMLMDTVVAHGNGDEGFRPISPTGTIEYEGREYEPRCGFDGNPDYHFFFRRGTVNKLVMYYMGGGACFDTATCGVPTCTSGADPVNSNPDNSGAAGFADRSNPDNPFKDWNTVFVTYCTCDIHYGDSDQAYPSVSVPFPSAGVNVAHKGFHNAKIAERFARETMLNPDTVFATGSSAGSYGALFHGALLHEAFPNSDIKVLGDAGNGVITEQFLQEEFNNWNFQANLPTDIPGVLESITSGAGLPAYLKAVSDEFPDTAWANYSTAFDGSPGGQTGFYNLMLNDNNPLNALTWWEGSCAFNEAMESQAVSTFDDVNTGNANYRYYIGTGSRHTMFGSDKVYTDQTGGESQTIRDWVDDMLNFDPGVSAAGDWGNVLCTDCGIVLPGDPVSGGIAPFTPDDSRILCP